MSQRTCSIDGCDRPVLARGWCSTHYQREVKKGLTRPTEADRFWAKVDKTDGCWLWIGTIAPNGYGQFRLASRGPLVYAHRYAYEVCVGPIPDGLELDHVRERGCEHTNCVNPAHLEPVTGRENNRRSDSVSATNARKTHCKRGHPLSGANLYVRPNGYRKCRACARRC